MARLSCASSEPRIHFHYRCETVDFILGTDAETQELCARRENTPALVEIVTKFPEELVIAVCDSGVSNLISGVECQFLGKFDNRAGIYIAD